MKKFITLLLFFGLITGTRAQVIATAKQLSSIQKAINSKAASGKDTIRKNRVSVEVQEKKLDSVIGILGIYKPYKKAAHASYYADKFTGKRTASGSRFDNNKYTAAHKKLPFGTIVKVTNEKNGKSVVVEITDRGPFVKSREIDLSKRAFMDIAAHKGNGGMQVTIEVLTK
jgi:rare lipoprotein A